MLLDNDPGGCIFTFNMYSCLGKIKKGLKFQPG